MDTRQVQQALKDLGFTIAVDGSYGRNTHRVVTNFQRGFAFHDLLIDGQAGPQVHEALRRSLREGGKCSPHFTFREFQCKCNRGGGFCGGDIWVRRELVRSLEIYRGRYGPTAVVSGCRCVPWNRKQGGKPNSQHLYGGATDLKPKASLNGVRNLGQFSGIGFIRSSGLVRHVDIRGRGGTPNTTGGSPGAPTTWRYG